MTTQTPLSSKYDTYEPGWFGMIVMILLCTAIMSGLVFGPIWLGQKAWDSFGPPAHDQMAAQLSDYYGITVGVDYSVGTGQGTVVYDNCTLRPSIRDTSDGPRFFESDGYATVNLTKTDLWTELRACAAAVIPSS